MADLPAARARQGALVWVEAISPSPDELASEGAGYLLYVALDELVETFSTALDAIGQRVVDLEEAVLAGDTGIHARILAVRKELITVRRVIGPMRDAISAVVTMISGIHGMNFQHMPELGWRFGYGWALGLMVVGAGGLFIYFKRRGWL
jgi:Mg2+ and Co2+ transporter CorA